MTLSAHLQAGAATSELIGAREGGTAGAMRRGCVREGYLRHAVSSVFDISPICLDVEPTGD